MTKKRIGGESYLLAKDGTLIQADTAVRIDRFTHAPAWATGDRKWIDVSILKQALVAYVGKKPAYVTLVSTGAHPGVSATFFSALAAAGYAHERVS